MPVYSSFTVFFKLSGLFLTLLTNSIVAFCNLAMVCSSSLLSIVSESYWLQETNSIKDAKKVAK